MRDSESPTFNQRQRLIEIAIGQLGAHYVWGGTGDAPGVCRGRVWSFEGRVRMHAPVFHRNHPLLHAAWTQISRPAICAGRSGLYLPTPGGSLVRPRITPVPSNTDELERVRNPEQFLWPRPYQNLLGPTVYGEACEGKRHFDCCGFVNWCISTLRNRAITKSILQWESFTVQVWPTPDDSIRAMGPGADEVWAGDIEISRVDGHIALLTGNTVMPHQQMVHAQDTLHGVLLSPCTIGPSVQGYRFIRRLPWFVPNAATH